MDSRWDIEDKVAVAGGSPVLGWLVRACLRASPWLKITGDGLDIDWSMALAVFRQTEPELSGSAQDVRVMHDVQVVQNVQNVQNVQDAQPAAAHLATLLSKLVPTLPFEQMCDLSPGSRRLLRDQSAVVVDEDPPVSLPPDIRSLLDALGDAVTDLVQPVQQALSDPKVSYSSRCAFEQALLALEVVRQATLVKLSLPTTKTRWEVGRRFVVANGDVTAFLKGASAHYLSGTSEVHAGRRAESWRLARRLVRAHADLAARLQRALQAGVPSQGSPEMFPEISSEMSRPMLADGPTLDADFSEAIAHLAKLEQQLARMVTFAAPRHGRREVETFTQSTVAFSSYIDPRSKLPNWPQPRYYGFGYGAEAPAGAFGDLQITLMRAEDMLGELRYSLQRKADLAVVERALEAVRQAIRGLRGSAAQLSTAARPANAAASARSSLASAIDEVIDRLITDSPLLALIAGGFLSLRLEPRRAQKYCLCLSPWVAATVAAERFLGVVPMTYLGVDAPNAKEDGDEGSGANAGSDAANAMGNGGLTGRGLWELMETALV